MESDHTTSPRLPFAQPDRRSAIRRRAEEIYDKSGRVGGRDLQNWVQAEQEIEREITEPSPHRRAIVVRVDGVRFVGEYTAADAQGYRPGEFEPGEPVFVRFRGNKMWLKRRNGEELETTVVQRGD